MNLENIRRNWPIITTSAVLLIAMITAHYQVWANDERLDDIEKKDQAFSEMDKAIAVIKNQQVNDSTKIQTIETQQQTIINLLLEIRNN